VHTGFRRRLHRRHSVLQRFLQSKRHYRRMPRLPRGWRLLHRPR
jgi:hypothetical protein